MNGKQKLFLVILGMVMAVVAVRYGLSKLSLVELPKDVTKVEQEETETPEPIEKVYVNVFFIGQNENREEVYRAVKRNYDPDIDGTKLEYAIDSLINGPNMNERKKGVYTEIPSATSIIYIKELPDKAIINLSSHFAAGGGTDSLYKRLYQIIKTAKLNSDVPVYLYIEGERADVIGGEGIMITQPLSDRSLDG